MTLPALTTPAGTPEFLASGHDVTEDPAYAQWRPATGHSRARRVFTVTERVVNVEWFLQSGQLEAVEEWFETTLQAGVRTFSARIRNEAEGPLLVWWEARWIDIAYEMLPLGRAHITGSLLLFGEGSVDPPEFGLLSAEFAVVLDDRPASVFTPNYLAAEFLIELMTSAPIGERRVTEDGEDRVTEDGVTRVTEA